MRAILICPNVNLKEKFTEATAQHPNLQFSKILDLYPTRDYLRQLVCVHAPEVVFLDIEEGPEAEAIAGQLERDYPSVQRMALHSSQDPSVFRRVLQLRMRDLLSPPFARYEIDPILERLEEDLRANPAMIASSQRLYAFLPAKAGTGASTIAANTTWAFGQIPDKRVLLADLDMSSGVTGFMFNVDHEYGLKDAAAHAREFDADTWNRVVRKVGNIELLLSGAPHVGEAISASQLTRLLQFSRRNYDVMNVDLPDTLNETSLAVLREANQIFLVTTPELPALRMARLKALLLQKLDLHEKVSILLNRASKRFGLGTEEVETTVGLPVFMSFPCDYANVAKSIQNGLPATKLSGAAHEFAARLLNGGGGRGAPEKKRFIEHFAILPMRYGFR